MLSYLEKNKDKINYTINFISYIIVYWYSFLSVFYFIKIFKSGFGEYLLDYNNLLYTLGLAFKIHSTVLIVGMILSYMLIVKRSFSISMLASAIVLSYFFHGYEFIDNTIHPLLFSTGIYNFLLRDGQHILNPQYTKIFLFLISLFILLSLSIIKKYRTIDRIFFTIITCVILTTTLLFHYAIPMGMFKVARNSMENELIEKSKYISNDDLCINKSCFYFDENYKIIKSVDSEKEIYIKRYSYYFNTAFFLLNNKEYKKDYYISSLGDFSNQRFDYIIALTKKTNNGYVAILDDSVMKKISRNSELWFSFLASCAHFIWIFGGSYLLMAHKNRINKRKVLK